MSKGVGKKQGTGKKTQFPTDTPPMISYGTKEKKILMYLKKNKTFYSIKAFARKLNIARSTLYDALNRLKSNNLIETDGDNINPAWYTSKITNIGLSILEQQNRGVGSVRKGCRAGKVSTHWVKYDCIIKNRPKDIVKTFKKLNYNDHKANVLPNMTEHIFYFDNATISVFLKKCKIRIHEVISSDFEQCAYETFCDAVKYVDLLNKHGLRLEGMRTENSHYAQPNSVIADMLEKKFGKYYYQLSDGSYFWIDHSETDDKDNVEHETDNIKLASRFEDFLETLPDTNSTFKEVDIMQTELDKLKEITTNLVKLEVAKREPYISTDKPDMSYLG